MFSTHRTTSKLAKKLSILFIILCMAYVLYTTVLQDIAYSPKQLLKRSYALQSSLPYQTVYVPFNVDNYGRIWVEAEVGGKLIQCQVDTGCRDVYWYPVNSLPSVPLKKTSSLFDLSGRKLNYSDHMVTTIRLKEYTRYNILGSQFEDVVEGTSIPQSPLLGNATFTPVVVTIDYAARTLTLRDGSYDVSRLPVAPGSVLMHFESYGNVSGRLDTNHIIVSAKLAGKNVRLSLDTGLVDGIAVKTSWAAQNKIEINKSISSSAMGGSFVAGQTAPQPILFAGLSLNMPVFVAPLTNWPGDGAIGYQVLRHFRITVDYLRSKILLERVPNTQIQPYVINNAHGQLIFLENHKPLWLPNNQEPPTYVK